MRTDVTFESRGDRIAAWWYPGGEGRRPCVVMAHGFGGTKLCGLAPFAERIASAGVHVLVFDYRFFGASGGQPRLLLDPEKQLEDYAAAIAYARGRRDVDASRVALWGTSFSGGHVVVAGARDGRVAAIVSQCPMMDGLAAVRRLFEYAGPRQLASVAKHGAVDLLRSLRGQTPHRVPIVGPPGSLAAMTTPDAASGFERIRGEDFENAVCARVGLGVGLYRPIRFASKVPCPWLVQICLRDSVAPAEASEDAARLAGARARVVRYDVGHFDVYVGADFERSVADQVAFLREHLGAVA